VDFVAGTDSTASESAPNKRLFVVGSESDVSIYNAPLAHSTEQDVFKKGSRMSVSRFCCGIFDSDLS
jgi:hypothetical protein